MHYVLVENNLPSTVICLCNSLQYLLSAHSAKVSYTKCCACCFKKLFLIIKNEWYRPEVNV